MSDERRTRSRETVPVLFWVTIITLPAESDYIMNRATVVRWLSFGAALLGIALVSAGSLLATFSLASDTLPLDTEVGGAAVVLLGATVVGVVVYRRVSD